MSHPAYPTWNESSFQGLLTSRRIVDIRVVFLDEGLHKHVIPYHLVIIENYFFVVVGSFIGTNYECTRIIGVDAKHVTKSFSIDTFLAL